MTSPSADRPWETAVDQLETLGLSSYAARTLVALFSIGEGTARDISEVSEVPRTRVYDAIDELRQHGLVDVQQSSPQQFWAVSPETTGRTFQREFSHRIDTLLEALDDLPTSSITEEQRGVWTVTGRETITERILDFIAAAEDEIVFTTIDSLLTDDVVAALQDASDRGVSIKLGAMSVETEKTINEVVPEADLFETMWEWSDSPAGRLLLVDQQRTLVSVLVPNGEEPHRDETAVWGTGQANSLVVVLRAMFGWQLESYETDR